MEKNKQQANEAVTQRVYYWEYDDGSVAALQFDDDCKKATALHGFPNLYNMHSFFSSSSNSKDRAIEFIKRKLHVGIGKDKKRLFRNANADEESMREGFEELKKMITSHTLHGNNAQVMNLLSLAMAGYVSRLLISNQEDRPLYFYRAPIIHVVGHKKDPCAGFEYLERIIESLSVDTSWDNKQIMTNPSVIPTNRPVDKITDCSYLSMTRDEQDTHCETQYRDTMVLIHPHFFPKAQWREFISRNVWASIFVFDESPVRDSDMIQNVDMNEIDLPEWNWNVEKVNALMNGYVDWLSYIQYSREYKKRWRFWTMAGEQVLYYSELIGAAQGKRKLQGSAREYRLLQIEALVAFLDFCFLTKIISTEERLTLIREWIGGLFPGYILPIIDIKKEEKRYKKELSENARMLAEFKKLIKRMLEAENSRYVRFVPKGEACAKSDAVDIERGPWAYLYWKVPQKIAGKPKIEPFRAVKIRKAELLALSKRFGLLTGGTEIDEVKNRINKNNKEKNYTTEEIEFIFRFTTERFKFEKITKEGNNNAVEGVILRLDRLSFLETDVLKHLQEQFPPEP